jgi:hypothetical protein
MSKPYIQMRMPSSEVQKFHTWARNQGVEVQDKCKVIIQRNIRHIDRMAKRDAPSDYGFLRGSIHAEISRDGLGGSVYTAKKYAPYQEWGTRDRVFVPSYVKSLFGVDSMEWKAEPLKRKTHIKPHPFLFANALIGYNKVIQELKALGFRDKSPGNHKGNVIISNMMY